MGALRKVHDALKQGYDLLDRLEEECEIAQERFDETLQLYANAVGFNNVEVGMLEYSSKNVDISEDSNGGFKMSFKPDDKKEEEFTITWTPLTEEDEKDPEV